MTRTTSIAVALLLGLTGCASSQLDAQWTNPDYAGRSLRGAPVLVACEAQEPTLQRICEDQVAGQIAAMGGVPTRGSQIANQPTPPGSTDPYLASARRIGARAIVRTTLTTGAVVAQPAGPTIGIGVGNGGYRGGVGGFGGISFPVGGTRVNAAYTSETALIDPTSGAIMWSARASSTSGQDAAGQIAELARTAATALKQSGLY